MFSDLRRDAARPAVLQGLIVAVVGYAGSVAVVIKGLEAVGANESQIVSGLLLAGLGKAFCAIWLSLRFRMPISIAWTTPGMALLATTGAVAGGFPAAVGALVVCAGLVILTAFWEPLARLVRAIPMPVANAMLAGILFKLCLAPFLALSSNLIPVAVVLVTWLVVLRVAKLWAVPAAMLAAIALTAFAMGQGLPGGFRMPGLSWTTPVFTFEAMMSLALPLFIVTMASQNITGLAVLATFGFRPHPREGIALTGVWSLLSAPFGAPTVNFAAITAALCASPDVQPDPARRYITAVASGVGYLALCAIAGIAATLVLRASPVLIEAAAGLALIGSFGGSMGAAIREEQDRVPALITFLVTVSGLSLFGIGAAFWGLLAGWIVYLAFVGKQPAAKL
jgi:benzoate membrane transport protein